MYHTWTALSGNKFLCEDCKPKSNTSKSNTSNYNKSILTSNNIKPKEIKTALKSKCSNVSNVSNISNVSNVSNVSKTDRDIATDSFKMDMDSSLDAHKASISESLKNNTDSQFMTSTPSAFKPVSNPVTINYCKLPLSILELFSNRFAILTTAVDDFRSLLVGRLDDININKQPSSVPETKQLVEDLNAKILLLEEKIDGQSSQLEELHGDRQLLLQENRALKNQMDILMSKLSKKVVCAERQHDGSGTSETGAVDSRIMMSLKDLDLDQSVNNTSVNKLKECPPIVSHSNIVKKSSGYVTPSVDQSQVVITNFIDKQNFNCSKTAFAVINTILPTTTLDDIVSCHPNVSKNFKNRMGSSYSANTIRPTSLFVKLRSLSLVKNIIKAKRQYNLLHTPDLDPSILDQGDFSSIVSTNIYINEVLAKDVFKSYQNLKMIAKSLGFIYVWHRAGSFLAKWNDDERSHVFTTAADLSAIAKAYEFSGKTVTQEDKNRLDKSDRINNTNNKGRQSSNKRKNKKGSANRKKTTDKKTE